MEWNQVQQKTKAQLLDALKVLRKAHPTFQEFCKVIMGEWVKIDFELDHLESEFTSSDLRFSASMAEKKR